VLQGATPRYIASRKTFGNDCARDAPRSCGEWFAVTDISVAQPTKSRLLGSRGSSFEPNFSSDGRTLSIWSRAPNGDIEPTIVDVTRGTATGLQLPGISGSIGFTERADSIIYRAGAKDIAIAPTDGGGAPNHVRDIRWGADRHTLYYAEEGKIFATEFTPGETNAVPVFGTPRLLCVRDPWGAMAIAPVVGL